jgi:hypothetical protein
MIPRLYIYAAGALAIVGLVWFEIRVHKKANERDAFKDKLEQSEALREKDLEKYKLGIAQSAKERMQLTRDMQAVVDRFNKPLPPPKTLIQIREVPGACPIVGLSDAFVVRYNQSSDP